MATWADLSGYIRTQYKIASDDGTVIKLIFSVGEGRSQVVLVARETLLEDEWAAIASPFAIASKVDLQEVLETAGGFLAGGVVKIGDNLWVRHSVPLAALDQSDFSEPLAFVTHAADILEQKFSSGDVF